MVFGFFKSPERELAEVEGRENYRRAMSAIAGQLGEEQAALMGSRVAQLSRMRPEAAPGVVTAAALTGMNDEQFNYMVNQGVASDDSDDVGAGAFVGAAADKGLSAGSWVYEQVIKPVLRGAFLIFDTASQELVQRPVSSVAAALGAGDHTASEMSYLDAYRAYGDSAGRLAFEELRDAGLDPDRTVLGTLNQKDDLSTPEVDESFLGTGIFAGGQMQAESELQKTLSINGEAFNLGRLMADQTVGYLGADPGEAAYDWTAGILQFGVEVATDPLNLVTGGTAGLARKGSGIVARGVAARGGRFVDEATQAMNPAARALKGTLSDEGLSVVQKASQAIDKVPGISRSRERLLGFDRDTRAEAGRLAQRARAAIAESGEVDQELLASMFGLVEGVNGRSIMKGRVEASIKRNRDKFLPAIMEADAYEVARVFGDSVASKMDRQAILDLGKAKTEGDVMAVILDQISQNYIPDRGFYSNPGARTRKFLENGGRLNNRVMQKVGVERLTVGAARTYLRFRGTAAVGALDPENMKQATFKVDTLLRQGGVGREKRAEIFERMLALDNGDDLGLGEVATDAIGTVIDNLAEGRFKGSELANVVGSLMKSWTNSYDQMRAYDFNDLTEAGTGIYNRTLNVRKPGTNSYETITVPGAHISTELNKFKIILPRSEELRRATTKSEIAHALYSTGVWDNLADLGRFITNGIFKPLALLRPAYIIRTQADDQMRMSAAGFVSMVKSPTEFLTMLDANKKGELLDLLGNNLRGVRGAAQIFGHNIQESLGEGAPSRTTDFAVERLPADMDTVPADKKERFAKGLQLMVAQMAHSPIANAMLTRGMSPKQMFAHIRRYQGSPEDAVRFMERDVVMEALARKLRHNDMFDTVFPDTGNVKKGRVSVYKEEGRLTRVDPETGETLLAEQAVQDLDGVFDGLLDEVAEDLGVTRESIEDLFDEFGESLHEALGKEWRGVLNNDPSGLTVGELGALNALTRNGARWGEVKMRGAGLRQGTRRVGGEETGRTFVFRGERAHLTQVAEITDTGSIRPLLKKGDTFNFRNRVTRATDDEGAALDWAGTDFYGDPDIPLGTPDATQVIYKVIDDEVRVTSLAWAEGSSDLLLDGSQNFRVVKVGKPKKVQVTGTDGKTYEDWRMEVELRSIPDDTVLGQMADGRAPQWVFGLTDDKVWDGSLTGLRNLLDTNLSEEAVTNSIRESSAAHIARRRIDDPSKPTQETLDEWVADQQPAKVAERQREEMRQFEQEVEAFQNTGEVVEGGFIDQMAEFAPITKDPLYVDARDLGLPDDVPNDVIGYNELLRGTKAEASGRTVRAYRRAADAPEGSILIRVTGEKQALRVGKDQYVLPSTDIRFDRAKGGGLGGRLTVEAAVVAQPNLRRVPKGLGGEGGDLVRELRRMASSGDPRAVQLLHDDNALMNYLNSIEARAQYLTNGDIRYSQLLKGEVSYKGKDINFYDPKDDKLVREYLTELMGEGAAPAKVKVPIREVDPKSARDRFAAFVDQQYERIVSTPAEKLSRLPTWQQAMVEDLIRQMPALSSDALRREVYETAVKRLNMPQSQKLKLKESMEQSLGKPPGVIDSLGMSNELMLVHATRKVEDILFDVSTRSAFQEAFDAWVPFFDAWREGIEIWAGLIKKDPSIVSGGFARLNAAENSGIIRTDERGNRVFTVPGSSLLGNWVERKAEVSASAEPSGGRAVGALTGALTGAQLGGIAGPTGRVVGGIAGGLLGASEGAGAAGGALAGGALGGKLGGTFGRFAGAAVGAAVGGDPRTTGNAIADTLEEAISGERDNVNLRFESQLSGANLIFQSVGPGFGPLIQWPAGAFLSDNPRFSGLRRLVDPFSSGPEGAGEAADPVGFLGALMPAYFDKFRNAWTNGQVDPVQWNGAVHDALRALAVQKVMGPDGVPVDRYDPADPIDMHRLTEDAEDAARALLMVRALVQGISVTGANGQWQVKTDPSAIDPDFRPDPKWDPETDPDGVFFDISVLASEYYELLQSSNDVGAAMSQFVNEFGVTPAYLATPKSKTVSPLPTDLRGAQWMKDNSEVFTMHPTVAGYFVPTEEAHEFNYAVWRDQFEAGGATGRELVTPEQAIALANQSRARQRYFRFKEMVEQFPSKQKKALLAEVRGALEEEFPGWQGAVPGVVDVTTADRIEGFERAAKDPLLQDNPLSQQLNRYFSLRGLMLNVLRAQTGESTSSLSRQDAEGMRKVLFSAGSQLANESPEFKAAWRVLSREVEE